MFLLLKPKPSKQIMFFFLELKLKRNLSPWSGSKFLSC